ncbi:MAG: polysaccharide deacetylase family protein [Anderseniella sp.]|nr:polysaccharide deacetylase family protein [Anderseniella sp.]
MSRALVLMYHQVDTPVSDKDRRFCTPPADFAAQMNWLVETGYRPASMDEMLAHVAGKAPLPEKSLHVTFDDGFVGVLEHALPTLKEHAIPATLFALPQRMGMTNDWMLERGFPRRALISMTQLRLLADEGVTIGSHTCTHVRLTDVGPDIAAKEIADSKHELEDILGKEVSHFAYPYGLFNQAVRDLVVQAGYRSACSTRSGFNRPGEDPFLIRRIDISGMDKLWQFRQKLHHGINQAARLQPLKYYAGRVAARLGRK